MRARPVLLLAAVPCAALAQEPAPALSPAEQRATLDTALALFRERSAYPEAAGALEQRIHEAAARGAYARPQPVHAFCAGLQEHLRAVTRDPHHQVQFRVEARPVSPRADEDPEAEARALASQRAALVEQGAAENFGYVRAERLEGNVGYLKLDACYPGSRPALGAALDFLRGTGALILDVRDNGGGDPEAVTELLGCLLRGGPRVLELERFRNGREVAWRTPDPPAARYHGRQVFALVGPGTFSAGEALAFALQGTGAGTVVGMPTPGAGGTVKGFRIHPNILMGLTISRSASPSGATYQGRGVLPDVRCAPEQALREAHARALLHLSAASPSETARAEARAALEALASPPDAPPAALAAQVTERERAFARTLAERDFTAFQSFLSEEAVFGTRQGIRGRRNIAEAWRKYFEGPEAPFSWQPDTVQVLASGTLALSRGPVIGREGKPIRSFASVWRLEEPGIWRVVFDFGE